MRRMKKAGQYLLGIFAALLLCGIFSVNTVKAESQHIYDNASLLSDAEEQDLERSCAEFENNTEIHMVILTERSSGSEDCQAIADDFYDKKYPKEPNGVCFLIDMGQRQIVISTSGIMQYYMSDTEIDDILQAAQGYAKDGDYAGTFAKMITMTQECFDRGVSDADYLITEDGSIIHYRKINRTEALIAVIAAAATGILVYFGIWKSYRRKKNRGAKSYADLKRVKIRDRRDALIDRHVSRRRRFWRRRWRWKHRSHFVKRKQPRRRKHWLLKSDSKKFLAYCVGIWYDLSCENKCISWKEYKGRGLP